MSGLTAIAGALGELEPTFPVRRVLSNPPTPPRTVRVTVRRAALDHVIEALIAFADEIDGDPDFERGADAEADDAEAEPDDDAERSVQPAEMSS